MPTIAATRSQQTPLEAIPRNGPDRTRRLNPAKPGKCPPRSSGNGSCTSSCKNDSNCPNNEKCCSNGCGLYCTAPYTVKPGQCPNPKNIPLSAESCSHDGQCPATKKCCPTTSSRACSEPRGQGSGQGSGQRSGQGSGFGQGSGQ
uniref:WAP domain-containing protein n=1 Tax=Cyprinus carpio carpio TaxID=630221 RepID=A0A9J7XMS5_CYPCA